MVPRPDRGRHRPRRVVSPGAISRTAARPPARTPADRHAGAAVQADRRGGQVVDGDTIDVELNGRTVRVHYIGVTTPETTHPTNGQEPCGPEAAEANRTLVEGQAVRLELDVQQRDRAQRLLAYVYVGDVMINAELVRQGYAQVARTRRMCAMPTIFNSCSGTRATRGRGAGRRHRRPYDHPQL